MRNTLQDVPAYNFLACLGDANARVDPKHVSRPFHKETNRSREYLTDPTEFGLIAANSILKAQGQTVNLQRQGIRFTPPTSLHSGTQEAVFTIQKPTTPSA
jgi:hypothetical protein